jgi:hypothetical protein
LLVVKKYLVKLNVSVNKLYNKLDTKPNLEIATDHTPTITTFSIYVITCHQPTKLHNYKTNWKARNRTEEHFNILLKTVEDNEEAITDINNVIQMGALSATPDDKIQANCLKYPWKVKDQIKA